jgi:hypothetical protein
MLSSEEYRLVWSAYALGVMLVMLVGWRWMAWVRPAFLRWVLKGTLAVILWTPVQVGQAEDAWAPGLAALAFGVVTGESALPTVGPWYVFGVVAVILVAALASLAAWLRRRFAK